MTLCAVLVLSDSKDKGMPLYRAGMESFDEAAESEVHISGGHTLDAVFRSFSSVFLFSA